MTIFEALIYKRNVKAGYQFCSVERKRNAEINEISHFACRKSKKIASIKTFMKNAIFQ